MSTRVRRTLVAGAALAICLLGFAALALGIARSTRKTASTTRVVLAAPHPGDVSYGIAQVRITSTARSRHVSHAIFSERIGGLSIVATSSQWRALKRSTRVYVAVSHVAGHDSRLRDVAFFIVRRRDGSRPVPGNVTFSIGNARASVGSYWVRRVDSHGNAAVWEVPNLISTAVANWNRYLAFIKTAHILHISNHSVGAATPATASRASAARAPALTTGGQRPDALTRSLFTLLYSDMNRPAAFAADKRNPIVPWFISTELNNPLLALSWAVVVSKIPQSVPDKFAAAAQEEAHFEKVRAPKVVHATAEIADQCNSACMAGRQLAQQLGSTKTTVAVHLSGGGSMGQQNPAQNLIQCGDGQSPQTCSHVYSVSDGHFVARPPLFEVVLQAHPDTGYEVKSLTGCDAVPPENAFTNAKYCVIHLTGGTRSIHVVFGSASSTAPPPPNGAGESVLTVNKSGPGHVGLNPAPDQYCAQRYGSSNPCPGTKLLSSHVGMPDTSVCQDSDSVCSDSWPTNSYVSLTATSDPGATAPPTWQGCDGTTTTAGTGDPVCIVRLLSASRSVSVTYHYPPQLSVSRVGSGSGTVVSSPAGINCGSSCSASFGAGTLVTLTAAPAAGSSTTAWQGCDTASGNTCTVTMNGSRAVSVTFTRSGSSSGTLDSTFGSGGIALTQPGQGSSPSGTGAAVVVDASGRPDVAGVASDSSGGFAGEVVRYCATGCSSSNYLDTSFGTNGKQQVDFGGASDSGLAAITLDAPTSATSALWVAGHADGGFAVAKLASNGSYDTSFNTTGYEVTPIPGTSFAEANAIYHYSTGKTLAVGVAITTSGERDFALVRYNANGTLDTGFNTTGIKLVSFTSGTNVTGSSAFGTAVYVDGSGNILAVGYGDYVVSGSTQPTGFAAARLNPDGSLDMGFGSSGIDIYDVPAGATSTAQAFAVVPDGSGGYVLGGNAVPSGSSSPAFALLRIGSTGQPVAGWGSSGRVITPVTAFGNWITGLVVNSSGQYVAGGYAYPDSSGSTSDFALARYNSDGTLDTTFQGGTVTTVIDGNGSYAEAHGLALDPTDGNLVAAGWAFPSGSPGSQVFATARYIG